MVGEHVGRVDGPALGDEGHRLEPLNRVDDRDHGGKEQRISEQRQGDVGEALDRIGAVDGRGLQDRGRDLGEARDRQHGEVADLLASQGRSCDARQTGNDAFSLISIDGVFEPKSCG
jgi:hypothetical protein